MTLLKKHIFFDKIKKFERYAAEKEVEIREKFEMLCVLKKREKLIGLLIEMLIVIQKAMRTQTRFVAAKIRCQRLTSHMCVCVCKCLSSSTFLSWILLFFFYNRINELRE